MSELTDLSNELPAASTTATIPSITLRGVIYAARKAMHEGRLQCLYNSEKNTCHYRSQHEGKTLCCVVGAALDDAAATDFDAEGDSSIQGIIARGKVHAPENEVRLLVCLQKAHDAMVNEDAPFETKKFAMRHILDTFERLI